MQCVLQANCQFTNNNHNPCNVCYKPTVSLSTTITIHAMCATSQLSVYQQQSQSMQCVLQAPHLWYECRTEGEYNVNVMKHNTHTHSKALLTCCYAGFPQYTISIFLFPPAKSQRDGTVDFWLDNSGFKSWQRQQIFSSPKHSDQLFNPTSFILKQYQGSVLGVKLPEYEADHSRPLGLRLQMSGAIVLLPQYAFLAWSQATLICYYSC
jgi:hypothetical protein